MNRLVMIFAGISSVLFGLMMTGCEKADPNVVYGYIEGEFVYVAAPTGGQLQELSVQKGTHVVEGAVLFSLDATLEQSARDEALRRLEQAKANLADAREGQRPTEIRAIEAQLSQSRAALVLAESEFQRQLDLVKSNVNAKRDLDTARSQRDQGRQLVVELEARLETAKLGARTSQIAAAEQAVHAQEAVLAGAEWSLSQKTQRAPVSALVHDALYRKGDWVKPGNPVVVLLPPGNVKVRAFVSQTKLGTVQLGGLAEVTVDGVAQPYRATISYIAPRAEFTPPVIYSQKMREKFVFLIELAVEPDVAKTLHPGQPVDVRFLTSSRD